MKLNASLKVIGEYIHLNAPSMEMYIPMDYFEENLAEDLGGAINVFGLLNVRVFDKDDKPGVLELMNLPADITIYPTSTEKMDVVLHEGDPSEKVLVCRFVKEDKIMRSGITQSSKSAENFVNMVIKGKIPKSVPYNKILSIWYKNLEMNGVNLGVPSTILEIILSESYRDKNKPEDPFRYKFGKNPNVDQFSYTTANMREICAKNSTFTAITFEDFDSMVAASVNRSVYNKEETTSPLEKIIKY